MGKLNTTQDKKVLTIKMPADLNSAFADDMTADSEQWLNEGVEMFLFDFAEARKIHAAVYRSFVLFSRLAKQKNKQVASINLLESLYQRLQRDGVLASFNPFANLHDTKPVKPVPLKMDAEFINPFIQAVVLTFKVQASTEATPGKPFFINSKELTVDPEVAIIANIQVETPQIAGNVALIFTEPVFLKIVKNMTGQEHTSIHAENFDAVAELLNIIYGHAKTQLNKTPKYSLQPAIPIVLWGKTLAGFQRVSEKIFVLPFSTSSGNFQMEIALEMK